MVFSMVLATTMWRSWRSTSAAGRRYMVPCIEEIRSVWSIPLLRGAVAQQQVRVVAVPWQPSLRASSASQLGVAAMI